MTASPAQIAANRANAQRSTGPRTPEGKAASARNALQHGAYASDDTILAAPNSPAPALLTAYTAEYAPHGPAETTLVRRLATLTARLDLLARAFDALPALCEPLARAEYRAEQFDLRIPFSPAPRDENEANSPAADPATVPDLAARTLVYALTSPRAALLFRHENAADRRFIATLHELQRLQTTRRRAGPAFPPSTAHLEAISDLLDRGYQLLPPDATTPVQNEPNPQPVPTPTYLADASAQNEPNVGRVSRMLHQCEREIEADSASTSAWTTPADASAKGENEADPSTSSPDLETLTIPSENEANSTSRPLEVDPPAPDPAVPQPARPAADLPPVIAAAKQWLAAGHRTAAGSGSVEDEVRALQALAGHISARQ